MYYIPSFLPSFELIYKTVKLEISILNHLIARQCTFVRIYIFMMCVLAIYVTYGVENENSSSAEAKGKIT